MIIQISHFIHSYAKKFLRNERGVSAIEYAILAGVIIVAVAAGVSQFGTSIDALFGAAQDGLNMAVENLPDGD